VARSARERIREAKGVYLVLTGPRIPHADLARAAVARGVPVLQLREKALGDAELASLATELRRITRGTETLFIVNDRPDVAAAVAADGVHVGAGDAAPRAARAAVGVDAVVGVSATGVEEALAARAVGADYVGVGPVFPTATKPDAAAPMGLAGLAAVAAAVPGLPVAAIGGIGFASAPAVAGAGASLVAVVSAVCRADDPVAALEALAAAVAGPGGESRARDVDAQVNHEGLRFCPRCASPLAETAVRGHRRLRCGACGYVVYRTPAPVTCTLVEGDGGVLLVRRRYAPRAGEWCLPAGFVEAGESPAESAAREVREETGLEVVVTGVFDTWATGEDPRTPVVCIAFTAAATGGRLAAGDDADDAAFFTEETLPRCIAFPTHRAALERYFDMRRRRTP
jgi:thiamine-phosphate pyrophosphorylase